MFSTIKGWFGEKAASFGMWLRLDSRVYRRIDNVIIPSSNGTTQIDHVLVSPFGVFVVETKNMDGWIFGDPNQPKWTEVKFGKKYQFQNPLRQNYRHTKCLSEYLGLDHSLFHSVVFFIGDCEFKTPMPVNVLNQGLASYIQSFGTLCLSDDKNYSVFGRLTALKQSGAFTKQEHLCSLHTRHDSASQCPQCGSPLVKRTAQKGNHAGREFLGCSKYPQCHYIRNL